LHCGHFAAGRRHWDYEHHAGQRARTDKGDRRQAGHRRAPQRHPAAIPDRGGLSALGGTLGIGLGFAIAKLVVYFAGWSTIITPWSVALAFGVSTAVGILFGSYPAAQASRLSPIEALRYE
jgi:hypothetical protein